MRRLSEHHRRTAIGRARCGPGRRGGAGLQLSGQARPRRPGGHRGGGAHRRAAERQPAGPAGGRGPAAGVQALCGPGPPGAGELPGPAASARSEYR